LAADAVVASQMMRGAGEDCSALFREYHSWVNAEELLKNFQVGSCGW
jgi:hypothetical protein